MRELEVATLTKRLESRKGRGRSNSAFTTEKIAVLAWLYYAGILYERRAKAQLNTGLPPHTLLPLFEQALHSFAEAEKVRPAGNDDAILRWNRCVRLLQTPAYASDVWEQESAAFDDQETPRT